MFSSAGCSSAWWLAFLGFAFLSVPSLLGQSTSGRIIGRVADPTGAVLAGVQVTLTNQATSVSRQAQTSDSGDFGFVEVVPGTYRVEFEHTGFKKNSQSGVIVDVNQVVTLNSVLQLGQVQDVVEVTSEAPQVDTTSTQLGAVINDRSVNELPLNTRDTYQFLQLQPGVQAQLGSSGTLFFGDSDAGSVSVNGGRTRANNFSVNGGDANDQFVNTPTIQPTPDSVAEFRMITNTFDAEYGRNSGSVVNVITKSGANDFHGNVYEYFRNTVLNAQGYFDTVKPQFNQNEFGGTFGGPIKKDRTFFFVSYEGQRIRQGQSGDLLNVLTTVERGGDFSDVGGFPAVIPGSITADNPTGTPNQLSDQLVADVLNGRPGCTSAINTLGGTTPQAGSLWTSVFPTGAIPSACQDPVAVDMLRFVPLANVGSNENQSVPVGSDYENQFTARIDHKINDHQNLSIYYYFTNVSQLQPYNEFEQAGANVPGFGNYNNNRNQQWNISHVWTVSSSMVNEARFVYMREGQLGFLKPQSSGAVTASCVSATAFCFTGTSDSSAITNNFGTSPQLGITTGLPPGSTGVPYVSIGGGAAFGNNWEGFLPQVGNSFQWTDELTWVKGAHTIKFGVDVRRARFDQVYYFDVNGEFTFDNLGPNAIVPNDGDNYAEYLLGLNDTYLQGSAQREDIRSLAVYPFVQDSWKIRPNLTLNYGLRWEFTPPPVDISQHVETFRPGQSSTVYPCSASLTADYPADCPTGLVVPGDKGVPAGLTSTYYKALAPRIGIAWSPGKSGKTSVRAGWGIFYNPIEELVLAQFGAEPPFGGSTSLSNTFFNTPFVSQNGVQSPNPFTGFIDPTRGQPVDLSIFRPMLFYGDFQPHLRSQYTAQYNLTIQRQLGNNLMAQIGYVGSEGHRLLASHDINPSDPQTCLDINSVLGAGTCAPTGEDEQFIIPAGDVAPAGGFHVPYGPNGPAVIPAGATIGSVAPGGLNLVGLRPYSSPNCNPYTGAGCPVDGVPVFTDIFAEDTIANSSYNALEALLEKRFSHGLQFQAAYTWSKSMDDASTFEETLNPFNYNANRALSLFNSAQRFVISYDWELPLPKHQGLAGKFLDDWAISGITQFQTGFPIRLATTDDNELINSFFFVGTEAPSLVQPFIKLNPKTNNNFWFDPNDFADPALGQFNNGTQRTICCGPGLQDWDFSVHKQIKFTEARYVQFRAEFFNVFNHTNFSNPDGNFQDGPTAFGRIITASNPRQVQFALKFFF